jgi:dihydrofolate synthase/folylpolyglutamate synthase
MNLAEWLAYIEQQHPKSIELGLERVREVAARMLLDKPAKHVITVGGTNGKGSTVAFIESIAREADWRVGTYTSPHLLRYNERVRIDGHEATDEALVEAFEAVEVARRTPSPPNPSGLHANASAFGSVRASGSQNARPHPLEGEGVIPLTYFEFGTLAALWLLQRAELDLVVLEVGLGGRLDAVNIVDPDVAVITTVDIDHTDWLGEDREKIGYEKAGIARPWKPLVLGEVDSPSSVLRHAYAIGANAIRSGSDFFHEPVDQDHWRWREVGYELILPNPVLAAPVQRANAATAITALRALDAAIPEPAFAAGVAAPSLPGRLQRFQRAGVEIVVDVGHNPQAARELNAWLQAQADQGETRAVFAALSDKDVVGVVAAFDERIRHWYLAGLADAGPRSQDADALAARLSGTVGADGERHINVSQALQAAIAVSQPGDRVLVFGSFHTAAEALVSLHSVL